MREIEIDELRNLQLDMMDDIHQFCVGHNIRYSLSGGSVLGAVRHKGFIPWDDDMDIMLPRPDYDRFIKEYIGSSEIYSIQTYRNDDSYYNVFSKIYDSRTIVYEPKIITGVFIDVFPVEGLPSENPDRFLKEFHRRRIRLWRSTIYARHENFVARIKDACKNLLYPNREKYIREFEEWININSFDDSVMVGAISGSYGNKEVMPHDVFIDYVDMPFENRVFKGIKQYDTYLGSIYGNYMEWPSKEKRQGHPFKAYWKE